MCVQTRTREGVARWGQGRVPITLPKKGGDEALPAKGNVHTLKQRGQESFVAWRPNVPYALRTHPFSSSALQCLPIVAQV